MVTEDFRDGEGEISGQESDILDQPRTGSKDKVGQNNLIQVRFVSYPSSVSKLSFSTSNARKHKRITKGCVCNKYFCK